MKHWLYLVFLLGWSLPILGGQWFLGWRRLWRERFRWPWIVLGLAIYFTLADAVAIQQRIWSFDPAFLTGWQLGNVPIEETLFYLLTAAMIVQGFVMGVSLKLPSRFLFFLKSSDKVRNKEKI